MEDVENCGNHVLVSGGNCRNLPENHKRRGYCVWSIFQGYLSFASGCHFRFWRKKKWKPFCSESSCIKNIRSKVKLLLKTDISHGKYTLFGKTLLRLGQPNNFIFSNLYPLGKTLSLVGSASMYHTLINIPFGKTLFPWLGQPFVVFIFSNLYSLGKICFPGWVSQSVSYVDKHTLRETRSLG